MISFETTVYHKLRAGYQALAVNTPEEKRCLSAMRQAGWHMAHGRSCELTAEQLGLFQELFINPDYADCACALEGDCIQPDVAKLLALLARLEQTPEKRAAALAQSLRETLDCLGWGVATWDTVHGFSSNGKCGDDLVEAFLNAANPEYRDLPGDCLIVFKDCHLLLNSDNHPRWRRALRTVFEDNLLVNRHIRRPFIFLQPDWTPHRDIEHCVSFVDFPLPDTVSLAQEVAFAEAGASRPGKPIRCPTELRGDVVSALRGLTQVEAANALGESLVRHGGFVADVVPELHRVKAATLKKDEALEYVDADHIPDVTQLGGWEAYVDYILECRGCATPAARAAGLRQPKGTLLMGPPGTAKSVAGTMTAKLLSRPLVKLDVGALFGGIVGATEANLRRVLGRIKAMGSLALMLDEADKVFAGMHQTSGDSGVGQRLFGRLLSWMALENDDAFVILTMNRPDQVPPEMLRAGRLDSMWFTELPGPAQRRQILEIHLSKNGADPASYLKADWDQLVKGTEDFVGAELEQVVVKAVRSAWRARQTLQPTPVELTEARRSVHPVIKLDESAIRKMLDFCQTRATPVGQKRVDKPDGRRGAIDLGTKN